MAKADVIQENDRHVRHTFRRLERFLEIGLRLPRMPTDSLLKYQFRIGQDILREQMVFT